jgi:hypothetical protein
VRVRLDHAGSTAAVAGPVPGHRSHGSFGIIRLFPKPDGNGWLVTRGLIGAEIMSVIDDILAGYEAMRPALAWLAP